MDSLDYSDNKLGHDEIAVPKETVSLEKLTKVVQNWNKNFIQIF